MSRRSTRRAAARRRTERSSRSFHLSGRHAVGPALDRQPQYYRQLRLEPLEERRLLAVVTVTTLDDTIDLSDGRTSLREAIFAANTVPGADTIEFAPSLTASGPATILLTQGELKITDSLTINGPGADLFTIDASGNDPTPDSDPFDNNFRDDADGSRIFNIDDGSGVRLTDNSIVGVRLTGGDRKSYGGAIYCLENLVIDSVVITGNTAIGDGSGRGGGLFVGTRQNSPKPHLIVTSSVISGNYASSDGGGIATQFADVRITASALEGNRSRGGGGAIGVSGSSLSIDATLFRTNTGWNGGAIRASGGNSIIENCEITGNVSNNGGGIYSTGSLLVTHSKLRENKANNGNGGAIAGTDITIIGSEIHGNFASSNGGGLYGSGVVDRCSFFYNTANDSGGGVFGRDLRIANSILTGNVASGYGGGIAGGYGGLEIVNSSVYYNTSYQSGGGVFHDASHDYSGMTIRSTTIAGNRSITGGGLYIRGAKYSPIAVEFSTITLNDAIVAGGAYLLGSNIRFQHSVIAENRGSLGRDLTGLIGSEFTLAFSLVGDNSNSGLFEAPVGAPDANGNLIGGPNYGSIDPLLRPAWFGPTPDFPDGVFVIVPESSSPVVNAGDPGAAVGMDGVPEFDERGTPYRRIAGGRIDIGAIEVQPGGLLPGDYQRDHVVDARDYTVWRDSLGAVVPLGTGADGNGDGVVDDLDFAVWRSNFGAIGFWSGSASVERGIAARSATTTAYDVASAMQQALTHGSIVVTTLDDTIDLSDGRTSLREAIFAANTVPGADTIEFAPSLTASGPATILLTQGELKITDSLTINGPGADLFTIDASGNDPTPDLNNGDGSRIFYVNDGDVASYIDVSIAGLTLRGGDASGSGFLFSAGGAILSWEKLELRGIVAAGNSALEGAAVYSHVGSLTIADCRFEANQGRRSVIYVRMTSESDQFELTKSVVIENHVTSGSSDSSIVQISGGNAVISASTLDENLMGDPDFFRGRVVGASGTHLSVQSSSIIGNRVATGILHSGNAVSLQVEDSTIALNSGVGIYGGGAESVVIRRTTIDRNDSTGIWVDYNPFVPTQVVEITDSTISNNIGRYAGGIDVAAAAVVIRDSVISNNTTNELYTVDERGGGIRLRSESALIERSAVVGNTAVTSTGHGGGILMLGGSFQVLDCEISDNVADGSGGGILVRGSGTIARTAIVRNQARGSGGGLAIGSLDSVVVIDSTVVENTSSLGGGISTNDSGVEIVRSTISGNAATPNTPTSVLRGDGGGIWGSDAKIIDSTIEGNTAVRGGGVFGSRFTIGGTTISSNAAESGGGLWMNGGTIVLATISGNTAAVGGGVFVQAPTVVRHSTLTLNEVTGAGGGVFVAAGSLDLDHTIVTGNRGINPDLNGTLGTTIGARYSLIGNSAGSGLTPAPVGSPDADGNLIGGTILGTTGTTINARLGPLSENGGPTKTHALIANSPAMNAGDPAAVAGEGGVPLHDQRGKPFTRVFGGRIDIGAVESIPTGFLPGDYCVDAVVDAMDYAAWRDALGALVPPGTGADGNGDGVVDERDFDVWKSNFGATAEEQGARHGESLTGSSPRRIFDTEQGVVANAIVAAELPPAVTTTEYPAGAGAVSQRLAPPLDHATQPPALPGVRDGIDRVRSQNFLPRDHALAAWLANRRPMATDDSPSPGEAGARAAKRTLMDSVDAAIVELEDDFRVTRGRGLQAIH